MNQLLGGVHGGGTVPFPAVLNGRVQEEADGEHDHGGRQERQGGQLRAEQPDEQRARYGAEHEHAGRVHAQPGTALFFPLF